MCGICGFTGEADAGVLRRMTEVLAHRGPDDSGLYSDTNINLGHRRLSIIDLTTAGHQPMPNEDESIWITFNGEIYNYQELKTELEKKGHKFKSNTDTEAIIHLYEEEKENCVKKLRGMFAFAIWDAKGKTLFLARDRMGKKPLYYTTTPNKKIIFASEIKSILQHPNVKREVNENALHNFLSLRFVPGPETMFKGIYRLQPGHTLAYSKGEIRMDRYWNPEFSPENRSENYFIEELHRLLEESVRIRLMSDVPLGVFLSGGLDSSVVTALMAGMITEPVRTFSVGFGGEADERGKAREVAEHYGTDHKEVLVDLSSMDVMPTITWHSDEPAGDTANIPVYYVSKLARDNKVPVILCGDGPDELYAGYEHVKIMQMARYYHRVVPSALNSVAYTLAKKTPKGVLNRIFRYTQRLGEEGMSRFNEFLNTRDDCERYMKLVSVVTEKEKEEIYSERVKSRSRLVSWANENYFNSGTLMQKMLRFDLKVTLPDDYLMKADKMTMAHSIEGREPHLDQEIAELSMRMPDSHKLHNLTDKYILRKVAGRILPKKVAQRKKQRFFVPIDEWFTGDSKGIMEEILHKSSFFRREYVDKALRGYEKSQLYYSRQLWNMMTFEIWGRIYIKGDDIFKPKLSINSILQK